MLDSGKKIQGIIDSMGVDIAVLGGVYGRRDKHRERKMQEEP